MEISHSPGRNTGPQGLQGATGATGPQGATGATGATGAQGPAGPAPSGTGLVTVTGVTASNGLTSSGGATPNITLGGTLTGNTTIAQGANTLAFTGTAVNGFSVDGTTFSVDGTNNRVGIGTSAPTVTLDVNGGGAAGWTGRFYNGNNAAYFANGSDNGAYIGTEGTSTSTYALNVLVGTTGPGIGGTSALYVRGDGNVGIGTSTPTAQLHVAGAVRADNNFGNGFNGMSINSRAAGTAQGQLAGYSFMPTFMNHVSDNGPRRAADIWAGFNGGNWGSQYLSFGVGSAVNDSANITPERMRITAAGNVGIGTSAPDALLDVAGTVKLGTNGTEFSSIIRTTNSIDAPSIAANSTGEMTVAISGVLTGSTASVSPALALSSGLVIAYVRTGSNAVVIGFRNTTGAAIDQGAINFFITVINP